MKKAFFINGGAGRVLCAIPALEHHIQNIDSDAIIVAEGWMELFLSSKILRNNVFGINQRGLLEMLKDREIISPEPYRLNAYFNQKANLIQAFDMLINYDTPPEEIPKTKSFNIEVGKADEATGKNVVNQCRAGLQKDKIVVFQPFGSTAKLEGHYIIDESGRSFEVEDILKIIKELNKNYGVILMSEIKIPTQEPMGVMTPEDVSLLQWTGIIKEADYFLGCDSVGQHFANSLDKPSTVVIGSTFPENITYTNNKKFNIVDNGKGKRVYSPIRITYDLSIERNNESLMVLDDKTIDKIVKGIETTLGKSTSNFQMPMMPQAPQSSCCSN
jgi:hypothetical protein